MDPSEDDIYMVYKDIQRICHEDYDRSIEVITDLRQLCKKYKRYAKDKDSEIEKLQKETKEVIMQFLP